jgi:hypothetical protein
MAHLTPKAEEPFEESLPEHQIPAYLEQTNSFTDDAHKPAVEGKIVVEERTDDFSQPPTSEPSDNQPTAASGDDRGRPGQTAEEVQGLPGDQADEGTHLAEVLSALG